MGAIRRVLEVTIEELLQMKETHFHLADQI